MRAYEEGMEKLGPLAMPEVLAAPDMFGNRLHAAAGRVYQAQLARRLVQPPTLREADRLTAAEMATLAFLADIDPYQISAQHVLLRPEIWAAREVGAEAFLRRDGDGRRMAALQHLLADTMPTAAVLEQPLMPELASIAGTIRELQPYLPLTLARVGWKGLKRPELQIDLTLRLRFRDHPHGIIKHGLLELGPDLTVEGEDW